MKKRKQVIIGDECRRRRKHARWKFDAISSDEYYDQVGNQDGKGMLVVIFRGGLQGLKRTRNPLKLPSNTLSGLKAGLIRGVKRKAEQVIKQEITKRAKKALGNKNVKKPCTWPVLCFPNK